MLSQIISFPSLPSRRDLGQIIYALALKSSGKAAEAERLLTDWTKEDPSSDLAKWGLELLSNARAALPPGLQNTTCRILASSL